jgi:tRNA threonylcarbamoyladenosine biosynthesis protein TsaB
MTLTVALDTATDVASVAVGVDGQVVVELQVPGRRHAGALLPAVEQAVALAGGTLRDVGRVLCANGPGSFTGLRIGFATAQALARANERLTAGTLPSLLAAAWTARAWLEGPVAAIYEALRGDVFAAVYRVDHDAVETLVPPTLLTVDELVRRTPVRPVLAVGDGVSRYADALVRWTGHPPVPPPSGGPRGAALLALDGVPGGIQEIPDLVAFEPDYGRPAEAQARWERAHGRSLPDSGGAYR